ncbi:tetratricopeptide repeat protein [Simiduia curdlanivorans]|uniref:Tetratricopeptide repeat protein n=1 Tax=Simiduia curdlanivorans TaxID=1492769 RepID=A0ABV8VC45_9GAMM|nr:tetratricopeptide repeat protein [Simiduia curdlanivorans]MDN3638495.1 tetratricopeptide repeat protein [Simiduia curdlanivorans]
MYGVKIMLFQFRWFLLVTTFLLMSCSSGEKQGADNAERHLKSAKIYEKQGQFRAAMLEARNVIQLTPDQPEGYEVLAGIYNKIGAFSLTISLLEPRSVESPSIDIPLAEAYIASKKYRSAIGVLEPLIGSESVNGMAILVERLSAEAYLYLGDTDKFDLRLKTLQAMPEGEHTALYLEAARALSEQKVDEAQRYLTKLVALDAQAFDALTLLGDISLFKNDLSGAEGFYTDALSTLNNADIMLADKVFVLRRLIEVLIRLGRSTEAYAYQKLLSDANPDSYAAQQKFDDAMQLYTEGDLNGAAALLKELREQFPQDKGSATLLGVVAQKQGDNELAAQLFDEYLDAETVAPSIIQAAALAKFGAQKSDEAVAMLKAAAEQQPDSAGILATYGLALVELNRDLGEATKILERSLALDPNQQRLRLALASSYLQRGNQEQALAQLKKAYTEKPQDFLIQQAYYRTLLAVGKREVLEQELSKYRNANPTSAKAYFFAGWYEFEQKDVKAAIKSFEEARKLDDAMISGLAHIGLAQSYEAEGELESAAQIWQQAIKNNPASLQAYSNWVRVLQKSKQLESAIPRLNKMALPGEYWQPDFARAKIYQRFGKLSEALESAKAALVKASSNPVVEILLAAIYQESSMQSLTAGDVVSARNALLKSIELAPDNISYIANLIKIELDSGNVAAAQKILDDLTSESATLDVKHYLQGMIHERGGDGVAALVSYRAAWAIKPSDLMGDAIFNLLRTDSLRPELAADFLHDWVAVLPQSVKPLLYLAMFAQSENNTTEAERLYLEVLERQSNVPAALNNLAWIYADRGDKRALETAKKAYDLAPKSPAIMDTYGWLLVKSGELKAGHDVLVAALAAAPQNKDIQDHVAFAKAQLK